MSNKPSQPLTHLLVSGNGIWMIFALPFHWSLCLPSTAISSPSTPISNLQWRKNPISPSRFWICFRQSPGFSKTYGQEAHVISALGQNGYFRRLIHRTVTHACLPCTQVSPEPEQPQPKPVATITVPYIQGLSEPIKRVLRNLNIQVCLHPQKNSMPVAEAKGSINARCPEWSDL